MNRDLSPPYQKLVVVTIDEMKIKEDLVFNKHSGNLVGFVDLGSADKSLQSLIPAHTQITCEIFRNQKNPVRI